MDAKQNDLVERDSENDGNQSADADVNVCPGSGHAVGLGDGVDFVHLKLRVSLFVFDGYNIA